MTSKPVLPLAAGIIRDARVRAGISKSELAERLGVVPSAISDWEAGKKDPSVSNLYRVIAACGLELRFNAVLPTEQDIIQAATDHAELASGNAWADAGEGKRLREKYGLRSARCAS
ncbi:MAG: helix-turn-helix transcriptional regulator [Actinobacteria bacterium]|nr:helix-turn-helix transcriptional regulator [Actinomycetota bacterium]